MIVIVNIFQIYLVSFSCCGNEEANGWTIVDLLPGEVGYFTYNDQFCPNRDDYNLNLVNCDS